MTEQGIANGEALGGCERILGFEKRAPLVLRNEKGGLAMQHLGVSAWLQGALAPLPHASRETPRADQALSAR
jgi:hypothetical protein